MGEDLFNNKYFGKLPGGMNKIRLTKGRLQNNNALLIGNIILNYSYAWMKKMTCFGRSEIIIYKKIAKRQPNLSNVWNRFGTQPNFKKYENSVTTYWIIILSEEELDDGCDYCCVCCGAITNSHLTS